MARTSASTITFRYANKILIFMQFVKIISILQIHDGRSAGSQIIGRYCGNKLPNNGTIISTHNSLYIWFHSDSTVNREGFAFNWTSIQPACGAVLNEEYGSISSPGYPGKYPTNRDCYWNINVLPGKRIALHFINLMLEEHPTCGFDYLEVSKYFTSYCFMVRFLLEWIVFFR